MNESSKDERDIFLRSLKLESPEDQEAFVCRECGDDSDLLVRVQGLIRAHNESRGPLDQPPTDVQLPPTADPVPTEKPGTEIGPFKLLQELGRGGMGVVYMAEQSKPILRRVALKIIKPGMDTGQVIARFEAERQALAMMDHPNIAKVLDAGTTESGRPYFVMEMVKGTPITQFCDDEQLPPKERLKLFMQVCEAVQHAHQKGIIHRDLKPSNVLVAEYDGKPIPKVIDFGVAKATSQKLTEKTMFTQFGQIMGTLEYMSPEQAKLNQLDIDTRSDVYSLGVVLYELLTGDTPFDRKRLYSAAFDEMLRIIREEEPPKPSTRLSSAHDRVAVAKHRAETPDRLDKLIKGDLDWIAMKALEKDRKRRYATASSLAEDIHRFLNDEAIEARPPSRSYVLRKFVDRHKGAFAAAVALFVTLLAGIIGTTTAAVMAIDAGKKAVREAERATSANNEALNYLIQDASALGMSGDATRTEDLIRRMKKINATQVQIDLVRAHLFTGLQDYQRTEELCLSVLEREPDNFMATLLIGAHLNNQGQTMEGMKWSARTATLTPKTPLGKVVQAHHVSWIDPQRAVEMIKPVLQEHQSGFARALYSSILSQLALYTDDYSVAEQACEEALLAQILLGDVSFAAVCRLQACDVAHYLANKSNRPIRSHAKDGDIAAEQVTSTVPFWRQFVANHYDLVVKNEQKADDVYRQFDGFEKIGIFRIFTAYHELKRRGVKAALKSLDKESGFDYSVTFSKAMLLALTGDRKQESRLLLNELLRSEALSLCVPEAACVSLLLGDDETTKRIFQEASDLPFPFWRNELIPYDRLERFMLGDLGEEEFVLAAETAPQKSFSHLMIGMKSLAQRQWSNAERHFELATSTCWPVRQWHVAWADAYLDHMRKDTNWPAGRLETSIGQQLPAAGVQP